MNMFIPKPKPVAHPGLLLMKKSFLWVLDYLTQSVSHWVSHWAPQNTFKCSITSVKTTDNMNSQLLFVLVWEDSPSYQQQIGSTG